MFYIGLKKEKHDKIFLSETIRLRAMIFGMYADLVDLYSVCSNYAPGAKFSPTPGVTRDMGSFQQIHLYVNVNKTQVRDLGQLCPLYLMRYLRQNLVLKFSGFAEIFTFSTPTPVVSWYIMQRHH